ncbi:MAG TPA: diguanylate cyclase, partial [Acidimicrobiales bacterium]
DGMATTAGVTGRTFRTGQTHHVSDIQAAPDYLEAVPGVVAELCVPLVSSGEVIGALNVESLVPLSAASQEDVAACAELLGRRLADLQPEQSRVPMRRLANTAASLVAVDDPLETVEAVLAAACDLAGMDSAMIALLDPEGDLLVAATRGPLGAGLAALDPGELGRLFAVLEPLTSCYSAGDATGRTLTGSETLRDAGARSLIALPLIAQGRRTGLLLVANRSPQALGPEVVEPLELLTILAGSCVENASTVQELRRRARRDPLTGLGNHSSFHEALEEVGVQPAALVMIDIDGFKRVNDHRGHLVGDEALRGLGAALRASVPGAEPVYRIGGDEFAVLLTGRAVSDADQVIAELLGAGRSALAAYGAGLSAGLAHRRPGEPLLDTLGRADSRLYADKRSGAGRALARLNPRHRDLTPT